MERPAPFLHPRLPQGGTNFVHVDEVPSLALEWCPASRQLVEGRVPPRPRRAAQRLEGQHQLRPEVFRI